MAAMLTLLTSRAANSISFCEELRLWVQMSLAFLPIADVFLPCLCYRQLADFGLTENQTVR